MVAFKVVSVALVILACEIRCSFAEADPCNPANCKIPSCRCSLTDIPGDLPRSKTPQIIMLTFDDAVSKLLYDQFYKQLLDLKNPNGCPIGMTFFTSHEYCDYALVHELWSKGQEIASHSISHKSDIEYWKTGTEKIWTDELVGMKDILTKFARIPRDDIVGVRVPFLQTGGNTQFKVLKNNGFLWDCSMPTQQQVNPGLWPYSLDYRSLQTCQIGPCPDEPFPGFWVVPMLDLIDKNGIPCAMLDTCITDYQNQTFDLLKSNFERSYNGNRAPYGLFVHAAWFLNNPAHWDGYLQFIHEVNQKDDVYFVTVSQTLNFTRNPETLDNIKNYAAWRTQCQSKPNSCGITNAQNCRLMKKEDWGESERYMRICGEETCPPVYPWVGNPTGKKP